MSTSPSFSSSPSAPTSIYPARKKQKKMTITQTYYLAHTARAKLSREAARSDHDLRLLVGHANLLDSLMLELAEAEKEQESWFNQSVRGANGSSPQTKHIQWADTVVEEPEEDWDPEDASSSDSDSDSDDSDYDNDSFEILKPSPSSPFRAFSSPVPTIVTREIEQEDGDEEEEEEYVEDEEADFDDLALTRTPSRQQPPELLDDDESSEDESLPPSPPQSSLHSFAEPAAKAPSSDFYVTNQSESSTFPLSATDQSAFFEEGYYLPPRERSAVLEAY
ncbi:hypothetical protein AJ80_01267 [Polytolypa hystricis UAMH7299]|uniref:Uncharacterized protein n=1 Tax=Polytolypa hystricis (strain UAMH7299) TaxID=1447883 RepID=A0A2B7Z175_POLH7|nr:hypothetical protein AJ80_01267 [Polytolypa hystricis UAMH7299]